MLQKHADGACAKRDRFFKTKPRRATWPGAGCLKATSTFTRTGWWRSQMAPRSNAPVGQWLDKFLQDRPEAPEGLTHGMVMDGETKRPAIQLSEDDHPDFVELMMLTDLQFGSKGFQESRFLKYRQWILDRPHCFVALGGDLVDAAT